MFGDMTDRSEGMWWPAMKMAPRLSSLGADSEELVVEGLYAFHSLPLMLV